MHKKTQINVFAILKDHRPFEIKGNLEVYHSINKTDKVKTGQDLMTYENPNHLKIYLIILTQGSWIIPFTCKFFLSFFSIAVSTDSQEANFYFG